MELENFSRNADAALSLTLTIELLGDRIGIEDLIGVGGDQNPIYEAFKNGVKEKASIGIELRKNHNFRGDFQGGRQR